MLRCSEVFDSWEFRGHRTLKSEKAGRKLNKYGIPIISGKQCHGSESENLAIPALLMWPKCFGMSNSCVKRMLSTGVKPDVDDIVLEL